MNIVSQDARVGDWMATISGKAYWPMDPRPGEIDIEDTAHALAMYVRFGGHVKRFYSVAEHAILVSRVLEEAGAPLWAVQQGLVHDNTEAVCGDCIRPIKQNLRDYAPMEDKNWVAMATYYGLPIQFHPLVKWADNAVLLAERDVLCAPPPIPWEWAKDLKPADVRIAGLYPRAGKRAYLKRYLELFGSAS